MQSSANYADPQTSAMLDWMEKNRNASAPPQPTSSPVNNTVGNVVYADPNTSAMLDKLETSQQAQPSQPSGWINTLANSPAINSILNQRNSVVNAGKGFGDAVTDIMLNAGKLISQQTAPITNQFPVVNQFPALTNLPPSGSGTAYNVGKIAGNIAPYMAGGEALGAARLGAETLPYVGKVAEYLGNTGIGQSLGRAGGSAAFGAVNDPNNRTQGAENGALYSGLSDIIPAIGSISKYFNPDSYAKNLSQQLGQGASTLEENGQALATDIRGGFANRKAEAAAQYNPVLNQYGNNEIYPTVNPSGIHAQSTMPDYSLDTSNSDLKNLFNNFNKNPTFNNAHQLQSDLGAEIGASAKGIQDSSTRAYVNQLSTLRNNIKGDMNNYLTNVAKNPEAAQQYQAGSDLYRQNVVPYLSDNVLKNIAQGKNTNPTQSQINGIFQNPDKTVEVNGENQIGPIPKIMQDMPPTTNGRIVFNKVSASNPRLSSGTLANRITDANDKGFSSYMDSNIQNGMNSIGNAALRQALITHLGGMALGSAIGNTEGHPITGGIVGSIAGNPSLFRGFGAMLPGNLSSLYRPVASTVIANQLQQGNQ